MSIRFKFRSAVNFDTVDIDSRPSISVRDLKLKIVEHKKLKICEDFDLLISDADTGREYDDDNLLVPSGSSVVIKRVPAGRSAAPSVLPHIGTYHDSGTKQLNITEQTKSSNAKMDAENFDDFGIDLCPAPEISLLDSDTDDDKVNCTTSGKAADAIPRCLGTPIVRSHNIESSDLSDGVARGVSNCGLEGDMKHSYLNSKVEEDKKLDEFLDTPAIMKADLPSELRCSLCNTLFKEAVMIPCCQHSFCDKCIRYVLTEKGKCPKCSSSKCKVEDLLPNVSLRQAIEHFLESQILLSGSDNILPKYAPDEESGIQAKGFSCAVSIRQRDPASPQSPSATGKGSNQVMAESVNESTFRNKGSAAGVHPDAGKRSATSTQKINQIRNEGTDAVACPANYRGVLEGFRSDTDFEGENQLSNFPRSLTQDEARRPRPAWVTPSDAFGSFAATNRYRKGDRTCYMCGSPDHFIRDCPVASSQHPMLQTGDAMFPGGMSAYGPPYWHGAYGASVPHARPFSNVYSTPGMMTYNPSMVTVNPYTAPSYMSSMYGGMQVPYGLMTMGGLAPPMVTGAERPLTQAELMELQGSEQRRRFLNEHLERGRVHDGDGSNDCYRHNEPQRSYEPQLDREFNGSYSDDSDIRQSEKKRARDKRPVQNANSIEQRPEKGSHPAAGRDRRAHHIDRSSSEVQDASDNSYRRRKDDKHKHHHSRSSKKHGERRGECVSDSSRSHHHQNQKPVATDRKRVEVDSRRHSGRHLSHTDCGIEPSSSGDRKRQRREKESGHHSSHSRHKLKSADGQLHHERWEMVDGSDDDRRQEYHRHPHKRTRNH